MDKVHCLKKLYTKLTGKEITDPDVDTICEVLHLLADDITAIKTQNVSTLFSIEAIEGNITTNLSNVYVKKVGDLYDVLVVVNFNVAQVTGSNVFVSFKLNIPDEIKHFGGAIGAGFIVDSDTSTKNQPCTLQMGANVGGKSDGIVRSVTAVEAGNYQLYGEFMIAQGVD